MPSRELRLSRIPPALSNLHPSLRSPFLDDGSEPLPLTAASCETDIEDYIGSGCDTVGERTPAFGKRLSFEPAERSPLSNVGRYDNDKKLHLDSDEEEDEEEDDDDMDRPSYTRPSNGRSGTPLLHKNDEERGRSRGAPSPLLMPSSWSTSRTRPSLARRSTMRSRSPDTQARIAARKKYTYAAVFLIISLVSFCIQTELAAYVQQDLGWNKAYCMLYLTHGSWAMLWPVQLLVLRLQKWQTPWRTFWKRHVYILRSTAHMVQAQDLEPKHMAHLSPWPYLIRTTAFVTSALTVAGLSWYLAVNMTSPSDLTAIYNCSAFFAYAFSVPLLKEKLRLDKSLAVLIAIVGVLVVAYGDSKPPAEGSEEPASADGTRFLGNMIIGVGSVLYGLYEVLYKRWACPPEGVSAQRGMIFANAFGSCIGFFTLTVLWIPLPLLHMLGWETFELPTGETALYLWLSVVMNATFAGSFLVLISLTSPVLSSVAALLTIFIVALADWALTGEAISAAALFGGVMIIVAFLMLSWSTWREMTEDAARKAGAVEVDYDSEESDKDDERLD
ncbi:uncharacterized protein BCR38DRAFT_424856 [Pseudomassariella vexata]|uniref:EamA domain-containing protein n=1 Tax=Pseudomassariella vexata TaxID=1141098 RepID=A0A1Y2ECE2_9PEZI|nr:uncharacterized protein BCR38DRAFT_424856 [Pseudomassariella vexata]ORY68954.1 hypothetical protein BCR38DRAFT_424856 [Pseudomassariella vexata]